MNLKSAATKVCPANGTTQQNDKIILRPSPPTRDYWEYWTIRFLRTGATLCILPLEIDDRARSRRLLRFCSDRKKRIWNAFLAWYLLDVVYLSTVSGEVTASTMGEIEFVNFYTHFVSRLIAGLIILLLADGIENLIRFFNALLLMRRMFRDRWSFVFSDVLGTIFKAERKLSILMGISVLICHIQPIFPLILHLQARYSLRYWPSKYLSQQVYHSLPIRMIFPMNDLLFSYFANFGSAFIIITVASYLALAHVWISLLSAKTKKLISFPIAIRIYQEQQILNNIANFYFSHKIIPLFIAGGGFVMVQLVISIIRSSSQFSFSIIYINYIVGATILTIAYQYVLEVGGKLRSVSWNIKFQLTKGRRKWVSLGYKRVRGCRDLRMYMGHSVYFDSLSFLYFLKNVLDVSITYLLGAR